MKWLRRSALGLLALVVLAGAVVGFGYWLLATENGALWLAARTLPRVAPIVTVGAVRGTLLGGLVLDDVRLRTDRDELDIERLAIEWSPTAALAGTLAFTRAEATTAAYRRLPGGAAGGAMPAAPVTIRIDAARVATLSITVAARTLVLTDARAAAELVGRELALDDVSARAEPFALTASATVDLNDGVVLAVDGDWTGPLANVPAAGRVTLAGRWPELRVQHELTAPFLATADGALSFASTPRVDLDIVWQNLAWPTVPWLVSRSGRTTLVGTLADYRYDGAGTLDVDGRVADVVARGRGAAEQLVLERIELAARSADAPAGTLAAEGTLDLGQRSTALAVTATDFDPTWIIAGWPGRLSGTTTLAAALVPAPTTRFDALELRGELRGYPVIVTGAAAFAAPRAWTLTALRLDSASNFVLLDGTLDEAGAALAVSADLEQVDLLVPGVTGALEGRAELTGTWQEPHASGSVVATSLAFAGVSVGRLEVDGAAGLAETSPLDLTIAAYDVARGALHAARVDVAVDGTTAAHRLAMTAVAEQWQATAAAAGGLAQQLWQGSLERLELDEEVLGPWRLEAPVDVSLGVRQVAVANSCVLHSLGGRWCAELDLRGRPEDRLVIAAQNFNLSTLRPLLPPSTTVAGTYQLSASLFDLTGEPRGALAVSGEGTRVRVSFGDAQAFGADLEELRAGATLTAGRLVAQATLGSSAGGRATLDAEIADVRREDSAIDADVHVAWPDLAFLALLSSELGGIGGAVAADLAVSGTVDAPVVEGEATWRDGRVSLPEWGFVLEGVQATARSENGRTLVIDGSGRAGDGTLTVTGTTALNAAEGWPTRLTVRGDNVRAVQLPEAEIIAAPDLTVDVALPDVRVNGAIHVPRAAITLSTLPVQAVPPSRDAVVHGRDGEQARPLRVYTAVELTFGDDVRYSGLNLETRVAGQLRLTTEPNRSASATGTLTLMGTYNAYGQPLALERGQLLFSGPLDDPGLDVRAVREIETTRVGVELAGSVNAPRTRIFSSPAMGEADALSYLLLGRPVTGTDADETSTLQTAAITMGLQQALPVVQRIGATLGLDELSVQTTEADAGALMAGKYLSPKLYIRYSYGLFNRIGGLLLRFRVNERLSIETRSGDQKSMDLLYTVEKD